MVWFKNDNTRLSTSDEIYIEDSKVIQLFARLANKLQASQREIPLRGLCHFSDPVSSPQDGKSSLKIESLSETHFGSYMCRSEK